MQNKLSRFSLSDLSISIVTNFFGFFLIISFVRIPSPGPISNIENLQKITLELFNNRRKKLKKKLQTIFSNEMINKNFLEQLFDLRAENITPQMYCKLALLLKKN